MRTKLTVFSLVVVGLLAVSVPLFAHHGAAVYDTSKKVTVKGTVTQWFWANPHCFLKLDEKTDSGETAHWIIESRRHSERGQPRLEQSYVQARG